MSEQQATYNANDSAKDASSKLQALRDHPAMRQDVDAESLVVAIESLGLGWDVGHAGPLIEARIWDWPYVIGRYRPTSVEPLAAMLREAIRRGEG